MRGKHDVGLVRFAGAELPLTALRMAISATPTRLPIIPPTVARMTDAGTPRAPPRAATPNRRYGSREGQASPRSRKPGKWLNDTPTTSARLSRSSASPSALLTRRCPAWTGVVTAGTYQFLAGPVRMLPE